MEQYSEMQVVFVSEGFRLIDAESYQRTYRRRDALPLATGYYVVSWPPGSEAGSYDEKAVFRGPFKRRREAETNLERFRALAPRRTGEGAGMSPMPPAGAAGAAGRGLSGYGA